MQKDKPSLIILSAVITIATLACFIWTPIQERSKSITNHTTRLVSKNMTQSKVSPKFSTHIQTSQTANQTTEASNQQRDINVQNILNKSELEGAIVGLSLRDDQTGEILFDHFGDTRLRPASNLKLLTGAAALDVLGPDYTFTTTLLTDGTIKDGRLKGDLYVKGQGDPTLLKTDFDQLALDLKEKGVTNITGDLIGDDTWYDDDRYSQDLNQANKLLYTGAPISALAFSPTDYYQTSSVIVRVYPDDYVGEKPNVMTDPKTDYVHIKNDADIGAQGTEHTLTIEQEPGSNEFVISGTIPKGTVVEEWRAISGPTKYALSIFKTSLEEQGIDIAKDSRIKSGATPKKAEKLLVKKSQPLKEIMLPFMKLSNNSHGEMFVKEMGKVINDEGSWTEGLTVMQDALEDLGMNTQHVLLRDGSGMSQNNLISPNTLTQFLFDVQSESWFAYFKAAQPIAGEQDLMVGGTLRERMTEDPLKGHVKAKTGTLNGVSTLSGYLETQDGDERIFSIMINNYLDGHMPHIEDQLVEHFIK